MTIPAKAGLKKYLATKNNTPVGNVLAQKLSAKPVGTIPTGAETVANAQKNATAAKPYDEAAVRRKLLQNYNARATRGSAKPTQSAEIKDKLGKITDRPNDIPKLNWGDKKITKLPVKNRTPTDLHGKPGAKSSADLKTAYEKARHTAELKKKLQAAAKRKLVKKPVKAIQRVNV